VTLLTQSTDHAPRFLLTRRVLAVVLVVAAVAWLPLDHDIEGPILYAIDATHGITTADLLSVALFLLARVLFLSSVGPWPRARDARTAPARPPEAVAGVPSVRAAQAGTVARARSTWARRSSPA
jgi:hypothetical protein